MARQPCSGKTAGSTGAPSARSRRYYTLAFPSAAASSGPSPTDYRPTKGHGTYTARLASTRSGNTYSSGTQSATQPSPPSQTASHGSGAPAASAPPNRPTSPPSMAPPAATHGSSHGKTGHPRASDSSTGSPAWTDVGRPTASPAAACNTLRDAPSATRPSRPCTTSS
uniref:Uncharacterized protein n=1 Tax=Aegilops tauschii subsp. strangulata TaxID=200361 RepID=A0A453RVY6_AEGTS